MGTLKLYGMRASYDEIMATAIKREHQPPRVVGDLLKAEIAEKHARSIKYQMTIAKLPLAKDIDDFDFNGLTAPGPRSEDDVILAPSTFKCRRHPHCADRSACGRGNQLFHQTPWAPVDGGQSNADHRHAECMFREKRLPQNENAEKDGADGNEKGDEQEIGCPRCRQDAEIKNVAGRSRQRRYPDKGPEGGRRLA